MFCRSNGRVAMLLTVIAMVFCASPSRAEWTDVAKKLMSATVSVEVQTTTENQTGESNDRQAAAFASGTLVSADGAIISVDLPESDNSMVRVQLSDGRRLPARILASDRRSGLRLLKIDAQALPFFEAADKPVELGESVSTVSMNQNKTERSVAPHRLRYLSIGIMTAVDRHVDGYAVGLLQSDVHSALGSAGSPLVDAQGRLVGIIVAADRSAEQPATTLAIPARFVRELLDMRRGESTFVIHPAYLGVQLEEWGEGEGAKVVQILADAPAAKVGLQEGDIIVSVDGRLVASPSDVSMFIGEQGAGATTKLEVRRGEDTRQIEVVLGRRETIAALSPDPADQSINLMVPGQYRVVPLTTVMAKATDAESVTHAFNELLGARWAEALAAQQTSSAQNTAKTPPAVLENKNTLTPLTVYVQRAEADRRLDQLTEEVKSLRDEVKQLTAQLQAIANKLDQK